MNAKISRLLTYSAHLPPPIKIAVVLGSKTGIGQESKRDAFRYVLISLGVDLSVRIRMQTQQSSSEFHEHSTIFPDIALMSSTSAYELTQ